MVAACVWVKIWDERVIKREKAEKKQCGGDFLDAGSKTKKKQLRSKYMSVYNLWKEGDEKMMIFERNDEKHSVACMKTHTQYNIQIHPNMHTHLIRLLVVARLTHTTSASSASVVTHFMQNWNEVEHVEFSLQLYSCLDVVSLYFGSILI